MIEENSKNNSARFCAIKVEIMDFAEAKTKTARWEEVKESELVKTNEDNEAYYFLYKKNGEYFKVAIDKRTSDFYSMSDTISRSEIENYEANNLAS